MIEYKQTYTNRLNYDWRNVLADIDFRALFQSIPGNYIVMAADDPLFTIIAENDAHAQLSTMQPKDIIGRPVLEAYPDISESYLKSGASKLLESFRKVIRTKRTDFMPIIRYDIQDGTGKYHERYWQLEHHPYFDKEGKVIAIIQSNRELTKELESKNRLADITEQLNEALAIGRIGTWSWDLNSGMIVADKNLAEMFGINEHTMETGLPLESFTNSVHSFDRERVLREIQKAIKNKLKYEQEFRTVNKQGTRNWVLSRGHVDSDEDGNPIQFSGVLIDITERKTTEFNLAYLANASSALASSLDYRKTLQKIAELAVPDIADWCSVEILNDEGQPEQVALAHKDKKKVTWARELNKKRGHVDMDAPSGLAKVIRTGISEHYAVITDEILQKSTKTKQELLLLRSIGMHSAMVVPLKNGGDTFGAITLISSELKRRYNKRDMEMAEELARRASLAMMNASLFRSAEREIAERKRLEDRLRTVNDELEQRVIERTRELETTNTSLERSNRELENFAYVASHDLQEPLRKIQAFSNLLQEEYRENLGDGFDYLDRMRNAAARMSTLIDDLLAFSRVTTKGRGFEPVALDTIVADVLNDLETRIAETKGTVHVGKLPKIHADPMQMRQLFQNLISNALKFHRQDVAPVIDISAKSFKRAAGSPAHTVITIHDNGIGFDEKYLDRIFSVFQRLHGRDTYEGTGIGLAVCRKIVERHGGDITATSTPNAGSTFILTLPVKPKKELQL